jgi:hypothetical protein
MAAVQPTLVLALYWCCPAAMSPHLDDDADALQELQHE